MTDPLRSYLDEIKDGHITDAAAREDIEGLVNDPGLVREACALFHGEMNEDATCYAVGKVYDVAGESYGCVTIVSEDVARMIGETLAEAQEHINHALISAFLEFRRMCAGSAEVVGAWDGFLELVLARNFPPLYENGMRARLVHNGRVSAARLPTVVFAIYLQYGAL